MSSPFVVAIDGPAGAGKSSVALETARRAGLSLVDTGAIYRALALLAEREGVSPDDAPGLARLCQDLPIRFSLSGARNEVWLDDEDITDEVRAPRIATGASQVSRHAPVRDALLGLQRSLAGVGDGVVLEGRDIGSVVFPSAPVKIFLTASPEERARRRALELADRGVAEPYERVLADIRGRDRRDSERPVAPLVQATGAVLVDTSDLTFEEVLARIGALIGEARRARDPV